MFTIILTSLITSLLVINKNNIINVFKRIINVYKRKSTLKQEVMRLNMLIDVLTAKIESDSKELETKIQAEVEKQLKQIIND